ncbi:uncharacterized protein B0H18DRAFT_960271 [Fomitopsis serialis]|uniref:uncharacterized protein n=1 Tax=Fomitopsis serialis TaxID=139415 RepID=UPI0020078D05|nr:uncharacterized protein B0H18DRAFT_960271 [Neoantrodia serialis]KAH9913506.1 hypothetical protein B0H18DRAFT_960271 [Neoantrodia serialis]
MRFASAFSFVLAAVAAVPALALPTWRSSAQERALTGYGQPPVARGWTDVVVARAPDLEDGLLARDDFYVRSYDDELYARFDYEDVQMQKREDARVLARELAHLLLARNGHMHPVSVIQQTPGDDGLYHWKLLIGAERAAGTVWHDVIWSDKKHIGMEHRGPKAFDAAKSKGHIKTWHIADIDAAHVAHLNTIAASTRTPKYEIADIDKNCQTWIEDVIKEAVSKKILPASATSALAKVPKAE